MRRLLLVCAVLMLCSCHKILEEWKDNGPHEYEVCNIKKMTVYRDTQLGPNKIQYLDFKYNEAGNPDSVLKTYEDPLDSDYHGEYFFTYDERNRLASYTHDAWQYIGYVYEGDSELPVRDTIVRVFAPTYIEHLTYDDMGRMIKVEGKFLEDEWGSENPLMEYTETYSYDDNGNLIGNRYVYDNKVSILRSNKVWMLVSRDWSKNNRFEATHSNMYGFPDRLVHFSFLQDGPNNSADIEFNCW